jgi:pyrimidine operon attenuation protein/uracil phosphoribosyltransferase
MMYGQTQTRMQLQLQNTGAIGQPYIIGINQNTAAIGQSITSNITYIPTNNIVYQPSDIVYYPSNNTYQPFINLSPNGIKCIICEEQAIAYKMVDDKLYPLCNSKRCIRRLLMKLIADMV